MVCHVLLEGQGWLPDHPDQLPFFPHSGLSFQTVRNKSVMVCAMIETFSKWSLIQSLLWAQVIQLTFIYLLRLAITPYCP